MRPEATAATVERRLRVSPTRVFDAFADAAMVGRWLTPSPEVSLTVLQFEFRVGGHYRFAYRVPGRGTMLIQGTIFAWLYARVFADRSSIAARAITYGVVGALLSWSFTTLAVAAKNVMTSAPDYLLIETSFTAVQWALVAPLTALVTRQRASA